ncbi:ABC transporter substrate-binding protein [Ramlibacter sp.]|uniref:ABC transporter substrate-binding protein n=1 Tax=Ramlibacter sp. TaxID=1917967 RepID=UPI003D0B3CA3
MKRLMKHMLAAAAATLALSFPAAAKDTIVFAYVIDPLHEAMLYALKTGKVTSDKVHVDAKAVDLAALLQGTVSKRFDLVETAATSLPRAIDQGLELKIVATALRAQDGQGTDIWVKNNSPIKDIRDIKGKLVGFPAISSTSVTLARIALWKGAGLNIDVNGGDFKYQETPSPALAGTLSTGRIDAAMLALSYGYRAKKSGEFRSIFNANKTNFNVFGVPPVTAVIVGYPEKLSKNPEAYRAAIELLRASRNYALANKEEVFKAVGKAENIDPEFFETCIKEYFDFPVTITKGDVTAIGKLWEFSRELKLLTKYPDVNSVIWDRALRE